MWPDYRAAKANRRSIREIERIFNRHILRYFGDRTAETVTRTEITRFIDEIARNSPVMARNVLTHFSSFYTWALQRLDSLPGNPCRDAGRPPAPKSRDRVLTEGEIRYPLESARCRSRAFRPCDQIADADWPAEKRGV